MKNKNDFISANEINKFAYCNYQWYYERLYGASEIRRLYKERNEALGIEGSAKGNFSKGLEFHDKFYKKQKLLKSLKLALFIISAIVGLMAGFLYYYIYLQ